MTGDAASSFSVENLPPPEHGDLTCNPVTETGTAENAAAAAAALTESEMSAEAETTSVVHHLQRDSVNTECDLPVDMSGGTTTIPRRMNSCDEGLVFLMPHLLGNTAGGMMLSPPWRNFSFEEASFLRPNFNSGMRMSMSPSRMNYPSPPSGNSGQLWNFDDLKGMMMRPTWKQPQPQPCIEVVDAASALGQNQSLGILPAALESENMGLGGTVQPQTSDDYSVNTEDEWFQFVGGIMTSLSTMNHSLPSDDSVPLGPGGSFRKMMVTGSLIVVDSKLLSHKELWLNIAVQVQEQKSVTLTLKLQLIGFRLIGLEVGIGQSGLHSSAEVHKALEQEFGKNVQPIIKDFKMASLELQHTNSLERQLLDSLERLAAIFEKNDNLERLAANIENDVNLRRLAAELKKNQNVSLFATMLELECGKMQGDSTCEDHIPKSSKTNEERYNCAFCSSQEFDGQDFVFPEMYFESSATNEERNNFDAKGGNSSSHKTDAIKRWEKDYGITDQVLQQLFGKSRDDAAKTLKVSISTLKRACRDIGINRWPNHKGKKPNCSLNQKQDDVQAVKKHKGIQPCPALPPLQATNTSQCNSTIMSFKVKECEEINQGTFEPKKHHDISSTVLGKKDHLGSIRGVGSYSTIQGMFGRPYQKQSTSSSVFTIDVVKEMMDECRQHTIKEMEAKMQPNIDSSNQLLMKNMSATQVSVRTPQNVYTPFDPPLMRSSCHSVDTYPVTTIKSPKRCTLAVCPGSTPIVVAKGMAHPSTYETIVHHQPLLSNCVKVWVDEVVDGGEQFNLPIPTQQYITIGDIVGNFAQWPIHLVILDESSPKQNKKIKDQSGELSTTGTRPPIVGDGVLQHLGNNCKHLVTLLTSYPLDIDYIDLEIDEAIFHHTNTRSIFVMIDDIKDLMEMNCLSVSIIQVFILYLNRLCNQFQVTSIGFACPTQISEDMLKQNVPAVTSYFIRVMTRNKDKQFILAPYHQGFHWLLLVICTHSKSVYVLDSLPRDHTIKIKPNLNLAFRSVPTNKGIMKINWKQCKCPTQPGRVECGYYVMRYMFDIVKKYSSCDCLDGAFGSNNSYPMNDINEIRELWAKYFFEECV